MNKITKLAIILLIAFAFTACKKDEVKPDTDTSDTRDTPDVVDTRPVHDGPICCNPEDLDNPDSLLSKRVIYFDFDQSTIRAEFRDIIALHGRYLSENPSARMTLEGHADERGSREYNLALGERRGNSVANLLRAEGASDNQINVVSYGEERPVAMCSDESCWSQNRRAVINYTAR
ncbi:peptidoglycan-associated lipoprotein Pal [Marinicella gelatinilytica]|uniref:peptidoglycan-associated lipoprotein Pal n=1 Tax=Marinicella gelatinilytica TaxID=2996017 RepID=UPI002260B577|nr:peptidoglycan-associated lipoprotein Pal [Marinicella gelatinilytica]MCX7545871.1 peptidoglycan-associated lipoprotein Pal [Marinicella gelatinilytica]